MNSSRTYSCLYIVELWPLFAFIKLEMFVQTMTLYWMAIQIRLKLGNFSRKEFKQNSNKINNNETVCNTGVIRTFRLFVGPVKPFWKRINKCHGTRGIN